MAADLRKIYTAITAVETEQALVDFAERRDSLYPTISKSGLSHWTRVIPFFAFPLDIRKAIYTTNAIESMNMTLRRVLRIVLFPLMIQLSRSFSWELTILLKHGRCPLKKRLDSCSQSFCYCVWRSLSPLTFFLDTILSTNSC